MQVGDQVSLSFEGKYWKIIDRIDDDSPTGVIVCITKPVTEELFDSFKSSQLEEWKSIYQDRIPQALLRFLENERHIIGKKLYCIHLENSEEFGSNELKFPWFCQRHRDLDECILHGPIEEWSTCYLYAL